MSAKRPRYPIGHSDFRNVRRDNLVYVDKTAFIDELIDEGAQVLLFPRPRRFGKTLNLSMLRYFFERSREDRSALFAGLAIAGSSEARAHFQRYPVIYLTFKDVKPTSWEQCRESIAGVLSELYGEHRYLQTEGSLSPDVAGVFTEIMERRAGFGAMVGALRLLSGLLAEHHGERVVILLDEYDSPIHAGYTRGYYDEVIAFFRDFLSGAFKDNAHLFKGVLTGILRVAKESLFSGLNNVGVFGILHPRFATAFGFTDAEVKGLIDAAGHPELMEGVRAFYNGYRFGGADIYNPWSVLSFLSRGDNMLLPFWIETSGNELVRDLLLTGPSGAREELLTLLSGGAIEKQIEENIVLRDVTADANAVWSFLLFTGYLKPVDLRVEETNIYAKLAVPNTEVTVALRKMVKAWLEQQTGSDNALTAMLAALLKGDAEALEDHLTTVLLHNVSFFDTAHPAPEKLYHGLVVGLLVGLGSKYEVRSNRESGRGRCDVLVLPKKAGEPGVVMELKRVNVESGETPDKAARAALAQIKSRDYAAELRARGANPIHEIAAVFDGKRAYVRLAAKAAAKRPAKKKRAKR